MLVLAILFSISLSACNNRSADHWSEFVPHSTFFVMVPDSGNTIDGMLSDPLFPLLDDISPSVMELVTTIQQLSSEPILVDALLLHPSSSNNWDPVWITQTVDGLPQNLTDRYQKQYGQNQYDFKGFTIEKLFISESTLFMVSFDEWTLFSESSFALESMLRSLTGAEKNMMLSEGQDQPGAFLVNTEAMDLWVQQLAQATYRPFLEDIFLGTLPLSLNQDSLESDEIEWQLQGRMELQDSTSNLVSYISQPPSEFSLDRFIPSDAAGFSIFRSDQSTFFNPEDFEPQNEIDRYIQNHPGVWHSLQQNIKSETAFVSFANSGPSSSSEYLFLRSINDAESVRSTLDNLTEEELVIKDDNTYFVNSNLLSRLLGSEIYPIDDFYITIYNNVAAMAQRKGLAESIGGDAVRRRVVYYDDEYTSIRNTLPRPLSSIHYINAPAFGNYIQPWLFPQNYLGRLIGYLDRFVITTQRNPGSKSVNVTLSSFTRETEQRPYTEQWVFPLGGANINGTPVLADLTGSIRNEVIFSSENGYVYALATDGTVILQASTNTGDEPVGPPVVYDWYGNNQNVIMQAAGNKIYAWNQTGTLLPNFPISLEESITTPLIITDITGNGVAEMIVATANRNLHILNARGQSINGWPQSTNTVIRSKPLIAEIDNQQSIFAFAENTLHAWSVNGELRDDYPVFLNTQMQGSPHSYQNHILGSGLDGNLYSVGSSPLFADPLSNSISSEPLSIQSLEVSNSSLNVTPSHHDVMLSTGDDGFENRSLILLQTNNGSLFLYDQTGELHFTESLGQPSAANYLPIVTDINGDQRDDLIALADFGRLYAWDILSGDQHNEIPTSGMNYPVISDFTGNGKKEIIAQTREGLQCWTINYTVRESLEN